MKDYRARIARQGARLQASLARPIPGAQWRQRITAQAATLAATLADDPAAATALELAGAGAVAMLMRQRAALQMPAVRAAMLTRAAR